MSVSVSVTVRVSFVWFVGSKRQVSPSAVSLSINDGPQSARQKKPCGPQSRSCLMAWKDDDPALVVTIQFSVEYITLMLSTEYDECRTEDHGCQHVCVNTIGGYRCECKIGYELSPDGRTCEGPASPTPPTHTHTHAWPVL